MPETISVRPADPKRDRQALGALFSEMAAHYFPDRSYDAATAAQAVADFQRTWPGADVLLAFAGDRPVGFATLNMQLPADGLASAMYLKELYVAADARSLGVGEALMRTVARLARTRGCARLDWATERHNPGAMRFYERLGGQRRDDVVLYRLDRPGIAALAGD